MQLRQLTIFGYTAISRRCKPMYSIASNARLYAFATLRQLNAFYPPRYLSRLKDDLPLNMLAMTTRPPASTKPKVNTVSTPHTTLQNSKGVSNKVYYMNVT